MARRSPLPSRTSVLIAFGVWAVVTWAAAAEARLCGDDVDGRDVPCHCGDIVVSDLVLSDDPVLDGTCPGDALIVRVQPDTDAVRIDLAGRSLRGTGTGTGIRILHGGRGGARVFSSRDGATIEGFRDGIVSQAHRYGLAELLDVEVRRSARDGVRIYGDGLLLRNVVVSQSGRDGLFVRGGGWSVEDIVARGNGRHGVTLMGSGHTIRPGSASHSVRAEANGADGVRLWGSDHRLRTCRASGNARAGVAINGARLDLGGCEAVANGGPGISGVATLTRFLDNRAVDNLGGGIAVHGHTLLDGGGNLAVGNSGRARVAPTDCQLGLEECR